MFYYITILLFFIAFFIYLYLYFIRLYYTNTALMQFREVRHKSILFLTDNLNKNIPINELEAHRLFLTHLNASIHHFDTVKGRYTKYKVVKSVYLTIAFSSQQYKQLNEENFQSLDGYKHEFARGIRTLFKTIPFFRQRILVHLIIVILTLLIGLGFAVLKKTLRRLEKLYNIEKDMMNSNGCFN